MVQVADAGASDAGFQRFDGGLPALGWSQIPNTKLKDVCPPDTSDYAFSFYCQYVIRAWGGGAFDANRNRLYVWGGGHTDYDGNEMYALDLVQRRMLRLNDPSPRQMGCVEKLQDGQPNSRHTYGQLAFMTQRDRLFAYSGSIACGPSGLFQVTWAFDPASTYRWTDRAPSGAKASVAEGGIAAYDPSTNKVYFQTQNELSAYDDVTSSWATLNPNSSMSLGRYGTIDVDRHRLVMFGAGQYTFVDLSPGSAYAVQTKSLTGCSALINATSPGLTYDSKRKIVIGWDDGDTLYTFDSEAGVCTPHTASGGPRRGSVPGSWGRLAYAPDFDAVVLVNDWDQDAFLFRLSP